MLKKLSFKAILYAGFGIVLALLLSVGIYSFKQIRFAGQNYQYVMDRQTDPILAASAIKVLAESEVATAQGIVERYGKFLALEDAVEDFDSKIDVPAPPPEIKTPRQPAAEKIEQPSQIIPEQNKKMEAATLKKAKKIAASWENVKKNMTQERDALLAEYEVAFSKIAKDILSYQQSLEDSIRSEKSNKEDPLVLFDQARKEFMASWDNLKAALVNGTDTRKVEKVMKEKGTLVIKASTQLVEELNERNLTTIDKAHSAGTKAGIRILVLLFFAVLVIVATAFLITTAAEKKVAIASTELEEVSKIVQVTAQKQVHAFQKALAGVENIKTAFDEIQNNTNQAVDTAQQLLDVSKRLTKM
jgi:methyl-accepting chemotaxis protein